MSGRLPPPVIVGPSAWVGSHLSKKRNLWHSRWSNNEIKHLEHAAEHFISSSVDLVNISKNNFPLPLIENRLKNLQHKLISGIGFELISGLPIEKYSIEESSTIFCGIGSHLGKARSQNSSGHILGHVRDTGVNVKDKNTRIYQTSERQSFHTDSSDVVALFCLRTAKEGGKSLLVSTETIYNEMNRIRPDLTPLLFDPIATDRRGEIPVGEKPYFKIPVLNWYMGQLTGMYQRQYIDSAQRFSDVLQITDEHIEALDLFDNLANDPRLYISMQLEPGDLQFVYNHSQLHDRTAFTDWPEPDKRRHLLRLWLSMPDDRPLPYFFKERFGSIEIGNRGGIITSGTNLNIPLR